jgi:hypothetical protein
MVLILTMAMHQVIVVFSTYFVFKKLSFHSSFRFEERETFKSDPKKKNQSKQAL